jgi:hypothetical protein
MYQLNARSYISVSLCVCSVCVWFLKNTFIVVKIIDLVHSIIYSKRY